MTAPIPLTVIGGFLGAGKTTLVNRILRDSGGVRFAVMVNDFGDLAIDGDLIAAHDGTTITLANGCVCCTLGDNFLASLTALLERTPPPEQILVEASGVADPLAIADTATLHPGLRRDLIVVLVDAESIRARADDERLADTVRRQLAAADLIVVNRCDLVSAEALSALRQWLASETDARQVETQQANLPLDLLVADPARQPASTHRHSHGHDHGEIFRAVTLAVPAPQDLIRLQAALAALPASVLRIKGFVCDAAAPEKCVLVERIGVRVQMTPWVAAPLPAPVLVFIGSQEMPLRAALEALVFSN